MFLLSTQGAFLALAILCEVIGTMALQASQQFTRLGPSILVVVGYALAFFFLSQALRTIPVGIAYAIWAGLGVVLVALFGLLIFGQRLDPAALLGMGLIIAGVIVINVFSSAGSH